MKINWERLIGRETEYPVEHRILNTVLLFGLGLALAGGLFNYLMDFGTLPTLIAVVSAILLMVLYYLSTVKKQYTLTVFSLIGFSIFLVMPGLWIFNGGILGGTSLYMLVFSSMITTLLRGAQRFVALGCLLATTLVLILLEYHNPTIIVGYSSDMSRYADVSFSLLITLIANAALFMVILNHYVQENKRARSYLAQIEKQKLIIEIQHHLQSMNDMLRQEVEERRLVEQALRVSEERFAKAFRASPVPMCIIAAQDGRFIDVNESFVNVFEFARQEVIGKTPAALHIWTGKEEHLRQAFEENRAFYNLEMTFWTKAGNERTGLYSVELIEVNEELCLLGVIYDITERVQLAKEMARLDRLNLVGEMAASLGHEIRNPLTTVRGFLQLLKKSDTTHQDYFDLMIDELDRANAIITEYLSMAKNKALDLQPRNLNAILNALYPLMQADAVKTGNFIHLVLGGIPELLLDEKEIRQLILNLFRNGLEAMAAEGTLRFSTYTEGRDVVLAVRDEGGGIAPHVMEKLGTPFFTTKDNGNGLGLAVCYSIAARHNASIRVETGPTGTTFFIAFAKSAKQK
ncbi:MAG: ATP-binding protein [Negativicutes bacterium]|nr:ATP-binding protein [Negativicutes bacterium]